jgi:hypothetical protein
LKEDKARASYALEQIGLLYDVERRADQEQLSFEERSELRCRLSYPIMVAFEKWMVNEYPKVLPKGRIGQAIKYTHGIYHKLSRYHLDGRLRIDNNLAENAIRGIALGRGNWLFCGNHEAAENAAILYSMMGCCKASGVNFRDWMIFFDNSLQIAFVIANGELELIWSNKFRINIHKLQCFILRLKGSNSSSPFEPTGISRQLAEKH